MSSAVQIEKIKGSRNVLAWFSFKSSRRGAIIFGLAAACMVALQGLAFAASYTSELARHQFATTLASNPALGLLYGEVRQIEMPAGYMVYRTLAFLALVGSLWGLSVATRLFRGQEEDGRLELLLTGRSTMTSALAQTFSGLMQSLAVAFVICSLILVALGKSSQIQVSPSASVFLAASLMAPVALFMCLGLLTSQLGSTRRRALIYGAVILTISFILRSLGNILDSLAWLKYLTPFGWTDKLHPVTGSEWIWFLPIATASLLLLGAAYYFAYSRDLNDSVIGDSGTAKARLGLLKNPFTFAFRMNRTSLAGWLLAIVGVSGLIAGLAKTASEAVGDSESLVKALGNLTSSNSAVALAFASFAGFFIAILLTAVIATGIGHMKDDETSGQLDNFVVGTVSRTRWLVDRALLLIVSSMAICCIANISSWAIIRAQGYSVSFTTMFIGGLTYITPSILMLGIGVLIYGFKPRIASYALYAWIVWSFLIEMVGSVINLSSGLVNTSLLKYISFVPAANANWKTAGIISAIGFICFVVGAILFARRDLEVD